MKAVAYQNAGELDRTDSLVDVTLDKPVAAGRDLLVQVEAISVNPVDYKIRSGVSPDAGQWKVLGWDAVGTVVETGDQVRDFKPGDRVWYAGSLTRPGANSEFHLVDERIAGRKPASLSNGEAAALPLTSITAWEMLFDRLDVRRPVAGAANAILIIGGAGGVGSIAIQLARALTDLTVIATASRPETQDWVRQLGAHHVIDHRKPLAEQVEALGIGAPAFVFSTTQTLDHLSEIVRLIAPQGRFGLIDDPDKLDIMPFKRKSVSVHWELMFTRPIYQTADMAEQGRLLNEVAKLVDEGKIRTTLTEVLSPISAANLKAAHGVLESGKAKGKIVLEGW
ncbi:zinc-binding alcohol dehydrogenase family protein [Ochrobactrum intermedium]|uniref:Zinc-type alcohol dehydrogenase-like protein n=1 Tax=Brucella intermedia TaxID=94625 RepID=A0ABR6AIV9_9HYPH|nr:MULTISPECIES: zinc-binding alcohol dehydrogenase family protein [Brucella/Ochrobactrum group]KAB2708952.1 zinc-binding alcohol dehydrogenase family protein [Brucella intermedia]MBA8849259.1 zinc-binding alcohol dehydrogenase family protein [Brucella intermedia]MPR60433.1 zinc-binding alcohol dehydrogenase family protein [Brucella intermedia]NVM40826.1 zinc-binding alcohol dehydrogenase family protein [Brucella intermedia]NYD82784.1 zinc-binding alcohol dehydrogenase family protein [Brucella